MHLLVLVDGLPKNHDKFMQWLASRKKKHKIGTSDGAWNPQIRELRMYDIVVPREKAEDWIADIKAIKGYGGSSPDRLQKIQSATKWFGKIVGLKSMEHVEPTEEDIEQNVIPGWWVHAFVLGVLEDSSAKKGLQKRGLHEGDELL